MLRWAIDLLKRDALVCVLWALLLSLPDPIRNRILISQLAAVSLFYISCIRLVHFGCVALVTGGEVRPSRASRWAVIFATGFGLLGWVNHLLFGDNEGKAILQELLWCVLTPSIVIAVWDGIRERPSSLEPPCRSERK